MLVISQKKGEKIHIGRDITITVVELKSGKVRLGIEAPSSCRIIRDSLLRSDRLSACSLHADTDSQEEDDDCQSQTGDGTALSDALSDAQDGDLQDGRS